MVYFWTGLAVYAVGFLLTLALFMLLTGPQGGSASFGEALAGALIWPYWVVAFAISAINR